MIWYDDFQVYCGQLSFQPHLPSRHSQIGRFRQVLGEAGVKRLSKTTIEAAVDMKVVKRSEFKRVVAVATLHEKAIANPSDSRLLEVARFVMAQPTTRVGLSARQVTL